MNYNPLVSVICTAYNHQDYIRETLEGFVMQQVDFPIEVIVHDDASTDDTASIIREYENEYPHLFRNIYQKENQYSKGVNIWGNLFANYCKGKYIAICEGDDYWIDPLKLQKQVLCLEKCNEFSMVYARVRYYEQSTSRFTSVFGAGVNDLKGLLKGNVIPTLSVCFRRDLCLDYMQTVAPDTKDWKMGDYPLWLFLAAKGKLGFQKDIIGVYRVLPESASHFKNVENEILFIKSYSDIKKYYFDTFCLYNKRILDNIEEQLIVGMAKAAMKSKMDLDTMRDSIIACPSLTFKVMILKKALSSNFICMLLRLFWA